MSERTGRRRIGVYICHCGGNISDFVDVDEVREAVVAEQDVEVAKTTMFACSDAAQKEMEEDIRREELDGLVVASCSPRLHTFTFRGVARRAGLNPYQYVQANIREQCSWAHRGDRQGATSKAISLVRAAVATARLSVPLEPIRVDTVPRAAVIGAGLAGLRGALALSDLGISVHLIEREEAPGGRISRRESLFPGSASGKKLIADLVAEVESRDNIQLLTQSEVTGKSGSVGRFEIEIERASGDTFTIEVGSVLVATGADVYEPSPGEYGYGAKGVVTLPELMDAVDRSPDGTVEVDGSPVESVVYIYCVGSRQEEEVEGAHTYCSRYCCSGAMHAAIEASKRNPDIRQYHLYRDIRTYGKNEILYEEANRRGSYVLRFAPDEPPTVEASDEGLVVRVRDQLTGSETIRLDPDLVVLVTGLVPRPQGGLNRALKLPLGTEGFFNEIHPKLRPVETVVDGVFVAGCCQSPKSSAESAAASLSAAAKTGALLLKGYVELEPIVAQVDRDRCEWCGECAKECPYQAIGRVEAVDGRVGVDVAEVNRALCKGCGACVPRCPRDAIDLAGFTDRQVRAAIRALAESA